MACAKRDDIRGVQGFTKKDLNSNLHSRPSEDVSDLGEVDRVGYHANTKTPAAALTCRGNMVRIPDGAGVEFEDEHGGPKNAPVYGSGYSAVGV
jgi:hypothetical protein